ncbi:branched-chain amino acid ABC transporter substrate-binding protein [Nocardioides ultimimeridianus]
MIRISKSARTLVVVLGVASLSLTACKTTTSSGSTQAKDTGCATNLAFLGAETGDYANLGQNMLGGIKLALKEYNATVSKDQCVGLEDFDSQGSADKAPDLANQIVQDDSIVGLLGPGFSGESMATGKTFAGANMPVVSGSATEVDITEQGWKNWHRIIGNDSAQGAADAKYMLGTLNAKNVFVIDDGSDYGKGLGDVVRKSLGAADKSNDQVQSGQTDFSATVSKVTAAKPDVVFYAGYYAESGLLAKQLRQAGYKGSFMSGDGSEDAGFVSTAGAAAANGALLSAPAGPAPADFAAKVKAAGGVVGLYSTQYYDATKIFLAGIKAGKTSHDDMNAFIATYTAKGVSGPIAFDSHGDVKNTTIYVYTVKNGAIDADHPTAVK